MPKIAQSIIDYKREYYNLQRAMNRLEQKWGGEYDLQLKTPLKKPSEVTAKEARAGLRRIKSLRKDGVQNILKNSVALIESVDGGTPHIAELDPFLIDKAYKEIVKTERELAVEDRALVKFAKKEFGVKKVDPYVPAVPSVYAVSEKGLQNIIEGQKRKRAQARWQKVFMGRGDVFSDNLDRVFSAYDEDIERILRSVAGRHSTKELIVRFKAWYRSHKGDPLDWVTLWDSISVYKAGRAPDLLRVMGAPDIAQQVEDLAANNDYEGMKELADSL